MIWYFFFGAERKALRSIIAPKVLSTQAIIAKLSRRNSRWNKVQFCKQKQGMGVPVSSITKGDTLGERSHLTSPHYLLGVFQTPFS